VKVIFTTPRTNLISRPQLEHTAHEWDASNCLKNVTQDKHGVVVRNLKGEHVTCSANYDVMQELMKCILT
jgi:hypothetical protein